LSRSPSHAANHHQYYYTQKFSQPAQIFIRIQNGNLLVPRGQVTGQGPSSRANARDLRKISPFGRNDKARPLREIFRVLDGSAALDASWSSVSARTCYRRS
jgi:hypothetical protein